MQGRQKPHRTMASTATLSPSTTPQRREATGPIFAMRPVISCPSIRGSSAYLTAPWSRSTSVWHMPVRSTSMSASSSCISGTGNSRIAMLS